MKDREYLQEMAYIESERREMEEKEMRELDRLPAKIIIRTYDGKRYRKLTKSDINTLSVHRVA